MAAVCRAHPARMGREALLLQSLLEQGILPPRLHGLCKGGSWNTMLLAGSQRALHPPTEQGAVNSLHQEHGQSCILLKAQRLLEPHPPEVLHSALCQPLQRPPAALGVKPKTLVEFFMLFCPCQKSVNAELPQERNRNPAFSQQRFCCCCFRST